MTAPIRDMAGLYRIVLDYEALQDAFLDRIDDLNTTMEQIDEAGEMTRGNTQKLLTKNPGGRVQKPRNHRSAQLQRQFGWKSLPKMLKGTGLALVLVVDDERFAEVKEQLMRRKRPRKPAMAGTRLTPWLWKRKTAAEMGRKRFAMMKPEERKKHQRRAAKAMWAKRRKAMAEADSADKHANASSGGLNKFQSSGITREPTKHLTRNQQNNLSP